MSTEIGGQYRDGVGMVAQSHEGLKVLFQTRPTVYSHPGGDTVVLAQYASALRGFGVKVVVDPEGKESLGRFSVVHLFNFATPELLRQQAERVHAAGVPFVVTTLAEDLPTFHRQSQQYAQALTQYVEGGQSAAFWAQLGPALKEVEASPPFENGWVVRHAARLLVNGEKERAIVEKQYGPQTHISVLPVGIAQGDHASPARFVAEYGIEDFILCVGRIESRKNQLMLLKALEHIDLPVVLAGGGFSYQPDYERAVRSFVRRGATTVLPRLSDTMLQSAYAAARVHALPSWFELPGLVSLEAAWQGSHVVAADNGTARDYLPHNTFWCKPDDEHSILHAVLAAFYSSDKAASRSELTPYSWNAAAQKLLRIYGEVVEEKSHKIAQGNAEHNCAPSRTTSGGIADFLGYSATDFKRLLEQGEKAAQQGQLERAEALLSEAISLNESSARALRALGAISLARTEAEDAKKFFLRALQIDREDSKSLSGLGMCAAQRGEFAEALELLNEALGWDPYHIPSLHQLVDCSYRLGKFDTLVAALEKYLAEFPNSVDLRFCLAGALFRQEKFDQATRETEQVLACESNHEGAKELLSLLRKKENDSDQSTVAESEKQGPLIQKVNEVRLKVEATPLPEPASEELPAFEESLPRVAVDPENGAAPKRVRSASLITSAKAPSTTPQDLSGDVSTAKLNGNGERFGKLDEQILELEDLKRRRELDKVFEGCDELLSNRFLHSTQREHLRLLKAESLILLGNGESARDIFDEVLKDHPESSRARCGQAALLASEGKWGEAEALFNEVILLDPTSDVAYAGLGLCAHREENFDSAWDYYNRSLQENPENSRALLGVIEIGYSLEKLSEVEDHLQTYLDHHPADLNFLYSLGGCYFAQGRLEEAERELSKVLLFQPDHALALELREAIGEARTAQAKEASSQAAVSQ